MTDVLKHSELIAESEKVTTTILEINTALRLAYSKQETDVDITEMARGFVALNREWDHIEHKVIVEAGHTTRYEHSNSGELVSAKIVIGAGTPKQDAVKRPKKKPCTLSRAIGEREAWLD